VVGGAVQQDLAQDLRDRLDDLLDALDQSHQVDDDTRRTAAYEIDRIKKASDREPPDTTAIKTRWDDLREILGGSLQVGANIGQIVDSVSGVVSALLPG
jgi:hypothetical protein